jgi:biofilm PGA synthesis N-glycosyltransferase PgaC
MQQKEMSVRYLLITPARNEEATLEQTIQSVVAQTLLPAKWIIVSDGSTDRTDEIVKAFEQQYDFIHLVRREVDENRDFASKVYAIRKGLETLNGDRYDFIGNLDADVTIEPDFYEKLFEEFEKNPQLGISGGVFSELYNGKWVPQRTNTEWSVGGCTQTFRWQCYEDIGGYLPLKKGGEDAIAEVMARKNGWHVRAFPQLVILHFRKMGTAEQHRYSARINHGAYHYSLGYMFWYEAARTISRLRPSFFLAEMATLWGYILAFLRRDEIAVPADVYKCIRQEQMHRLKRVLKTKVLKIDKIKKCIGIQK